MDVLSVVSKLSTVFQRDLIDIETVNIMVESTVMKLNQLKNKNGPELSKMYEEMTSTKCVQRVETDWQRIAENAVSE